ncbi:MAG: hypothetical protein JW944_12725 [Deltaproteobacteria bacterium]|nr:hypothetical protein [Deltaproteobacteria bacterium]
MSEYELEKDTILSKISRYELVRGKDAEKIFIDIHHILSDENKGVFVAVPNNSLQSAKQNYIMSGTSEDEVLRLCLESIKGVENRDILNSKENKS